MRHLPPAKLKEKSYPVFLWNRPGPVIAGHSLTEQLPIESGNSPDPWQSSPNPVKERPSLKKGTTSTKENMIIQCFQENSELARVDVTKSFGLLLILSKPV